MKIPVIYKQHCQKFIYYTSSKLKRAELALSIATGTTIKENYKEKDQTSEPEVQTYLAQCNSQLFVY